MFSFDEFEDMCEKLAEAWQQNGVTPKKYGLSLQKKHLHKPFTPYQYIPITPKNLPYMRRTF